MNKINNNIAICVATYKRNDLLKYCLSKIKLLELPRKNRIVLIVVDNDSSKAAKPVIDLFNKNYPFKIYYFVEKERGISSAPASIIIAAPAGSVTPSHDDEAILSPLLCASTN